MTPWRPSGHCCGELNPAAPRFCGLQIFRWILALVKRIAANELFPSAKEYDLLELFMRHPRQVLTRDMIFDRVWGYDFGGESNIIEVYIRYLRQKLELSGEARLLHTVRGMGYVLREPS